MADYKVMDKKTSIFNIMLSGVKLDLWMQPLFAHRHLKRIVLLVMDELIIREGYKANLPMDLIVLYESIEHEFKGYMPLRIRIKRYAFYLGKLYGYICSNINKSVAVKIVKEARSKALIEERNRLVRIQKNTLPGMSGQGKRLRRKIGLL